MLDSKAVAAVKQGVDGRWTLYIRCNYVENLAIWSFRKHLVTFDTEIKALTEFKRLYPLGQIVGFDDLPGRQSN